MSARLDVRRVRRSARLLTRGITSERGGIVPTILQIVNRTVLPFKYVLKVSTIRSMSKR